MAIGEEISTKFTIKDTQGAVLLFDTNQQEIDESP